MTTYGCGKSPPSVVPKLTSAPEYDEYLDRPMHHAWVEDNDEAAIAAPPQNPKICHLRLRIVLDRKHDEKDDVHNYCTFN